MRSGSHLNFRGSSIPFQVTNSIHWVTCKLFPSMRESPGSEICWMRCALDKTNTKYSEVFSTVSSFSAFLSSFRLLWLPENNFSLQLLPFLFLPTHNFNVARCMQKEVGLRVGLQEKRIKWEVASAFCFCDPAIGGIFSFDPSNTLNDIYFNCNVLLFADPPPSHVYRTPKME